MTAPSPLARRLVLPAVLALVSGAIVRPSAEAPADYVKTIEQWRQERERSLKAPEGWLSVSGLFFVEPGEMRVGSAEGCAIVLTDVPAHALTLVVSAQGVRFRAAEGVEIRLNGQPVKEGELRPADEEGDRPADKLTVGRHSLQLHRSGDRLAIRTRDPEHRIRREFRGLAWWPVKEEMRVTARFVPHPKPVEIPITNLLGDTSAVPSPGTVEFTLDGKRLSLLALEGSKQNPLWFVFRDATSGRMSYGAGRFLYAGPPRDGTVVLDFNKAYNPPCAYNPFTTCPLPPKQNWLPVAIEAGERDYPGGPHGPGSASP